jgi:hypothetical protein
MFNEPILNPSQRIKTTALQEISARILDGAFVTVGQTAVIEINISLTRFVSNFLARILIYDAEGRCAFASILDNKGSFDPGHYSIHLFFLANLQTGKYAASFEFSETKPAENEVQSRDILWLHNLFVEFAVKSEDVNLHDSEIEATSGYANIPCSVSVSAQSTKQLELSAASKSSSTANFPYPLKGAQFNLLEIENAIARVFNTEQLGEEYTSSKLRSLLTPTSFKRRFLANTVPMHTGKGVGVPNGVGIVSTGIAGYLLFGPYLSILPGHYVVTFLGKNGPTLASQITVEVSAKQGAVILNRTVPLLDGDAIINLSLEIYVESPGFVDLEFRVHVGAGAQVSIDEIFINPVIDASSPGTAKIESLLSAIVPGNQPFGSLRNSNPDKKLSKLSPNRAIVFISNPIYTLCGLAVAYHLHKKFGYQITLVSAQTNSEAVTESVKQLCGIDNCALLAEIKGRNLVSEVALIVTHRADQFEPILKQLSKKTRHIDFQIYSDGFRNAVDTHGLKQLSKISKIYFFGMDYFHSEPFNACKTEIIDFSTTRKLIARCAQSYRLNGFENTEKYSPYSVFCVRYWGLHYYAFPAEIVADVWYETIAQHTPKEELIILKGGGASVVDSESCSILKEKLSSNGYRYIDADEYLMSCGLNKGSSELALEYLIYFGLFKQATRFYTLDSSLPVILAHLDFVRRPVEIVCGAKDLSRLQNSNGFYALNAHMLQLQRTFDRSDEFKPCDVKKIEDDHFVIKLK